MVGVVTRGMYVRVYDALSIDRQGAPQGPLTQRTPKPTLEEGASDRSDPFARSVSADWTHSKVR